jgi:hypothetical protein
MISQRAEACQALQDAPSGNRLLDVLVEVLPERASVQRALNSIFHQATASQFVER